jgi:hypothetical protein
MLISISNNHRPAEWEDRWGQSVSVLWPRQLREGGLRDRRELCISCSNLKSRNSCPFCGTWTGRLVLVSNSYNSPQSVSLAGTGGMFTGDNFGDEPHFRYSGSQ